MSTYDFSRISVLIVEDNVYIRNTFENLLRTFKFGKIEKANNGEEAIRYLKMMKQANNPGPDLIFSDLAMAPINGLMLLRWVRASKDCPNRMVPFLMISGAADRNYVNSARDLGVSEFIAKPFSVTSVYERFLEIIDYPRQFVTTQNYFGPDRRRVKNSTNSSGPERRENSDNDVIIVYSSDIPLPKKDITAPLCLLLPLTNTNMLSEGNPLRFAGLTKVAASLIGCVFTLKEGTIVLIISAISPAP